MNGSFRDRVEALRRRVSPSGEYAPSHRSAQCDCLLTANSLADLVSVDAAKLGKTSNGLCPRCSADLNAMRQQAALLQTLRSPANMEPAGGFYARVLQRIEETTKESIWAFFIYSPVGKRLVYASLTLAVLFGTYFVGKESVDGHLGTSPVAEEASVMPVSGNPAQQRDAVLVNFASYEATSQ